MADVAYTLIYLINFGDAASAQEFGTAVVTNSAAIATSVTESLDAVLGVNITSVTVNAVAVEVVSDDSNGTPLQSTCLSAVLGFAAFW
jgi:hypothetical protein